MEEDELPAGLPNPNQHKAQGFMKPGAAQQDEEEEIMQNKAQGFMKPGGARMEEEEEPVQAMPRPEQEGSSGRERPGSDVMFNPQPEPPADPVMPQQPGGFTK
jgi:hypothetical protein